MEINSQNIMILLGAGFSKPAGMPLAKEINDYFLRDNAETLLNFGSGEWKWIDFANSPERNNGKLGFDAHTYGYILNQWVRSFIEQTGEFTNYEDFYQYTFDNYRSKLIRDSIHSKAYEEFLKCHSIPEDDSYYRRYTDAFINPQNRVIISLINHLIGDLLYIRSPFHEILPNYLPFVNLIRNFEKVNIVTLNHDFILEAIFEEMGIEYTDGYTIDDSPLQSDKCTKIRFFNNSFSKNTSLIKLHGSIDTYQFTIAKQEGAVYDATGEYLYYKTHDYYEKQSPVLVNPKTGEVIQNFHWDITPKFITGTRKDELIANDTMYASLYNEFDNRIHESQNLLIIGYSFSDKHVNDKILSTMQSGMKMKIINVNPSLDFPYTGGNIEILNLRSITELDNSIFQT